MQLGTDNDQSDGGTGLQNILYFASMIGFMIFANWARPQAGEQSLWALIFQYKWYLAIALQYYLSIS